MKQTLVCAALTAAVISTIGCEMKDSSSTNDRSAASALQFATARIHINGFKKSKSGAT